jgi:hypothetical protein
MSTNENANNERLRELIDGAGLSHTAALGHFNAKLIVRPISESAWRSYFCTPTTRRYRPFSDALLAHAEKVFAPLQLSI